MMGESILDGLKKLRDRLYALLVNEQPTLERKNALDKLESTIAWLEGDPA